MTSIYKRFQRAALFGFLMLTISLDSCKKLIEVNPPLTSLVNTSVYSSDATAIAILTGIYAQISSASPGLTGSIPSISLFTGLSSDELSLWSGAVTFHANSVQYYHNTLSVSSAFGGVGQGTEFWAPLYAYIFECNDAIAGLSASTTLTPAVKQQLLGEARLMRAFFYFYLVNLYGNVPLALTTDYTVNSSLAKTPKALVYAQIIADLHIAQKLLSTHYLDGTLLNTVADRVRPTTWAATALLARADLYAGNWAGADSASTVLINNSSTFTLNPDLNNVFLEASSGNNEAIWQLQPVTASPANTHDGVAFIMTSAGPGQAGNFGAYLSPNLLYSFEPGDSRMSKWIGNITVSGTTYYYPFKYKQNSLEAGYPVTEYYMVLRLGEQFLIRSEARAQEGNTASAQADLNAIRSRAGLGATTASTPSTLLTAILHERQVELFCEIGQRWFDLKRTGNIDGVMTIVTPQKTAGTSTWNSYQQLYPIPENEIFLNHNLVQNTGY